MQKLLDWKISFVTDPFDNGTIRRLKLDAWSFLAILFDSEYNIQSSINWREKKSCSKFQKIVVIFKFVVDWVVKKICLMFSVTIYSIFLNKNVFAFLHSVKISYCQNQTNDAFWKWKLQTWKRAQLSCDFFCTKLQQFQIFSIRILYSLYQYVASKLHGTMLWQLIADHNEWPNRIQIIRRFLFELVAVWYHWIEIIEK